MRARKFSTTGADDDDDNCNDGGGDDDETNEDDLPRVGAVSDGWIRTRPAQGQVRR